jgi:hypothetical protein
MSQHHIYRIILDILIALCIIQGWWFIALPLCILGIWRHGYFLEILLAGFAYDALFGAGTDIAVMRYVGISVATAVFVIFLFLKKMLRR